MPVGPSKLLSSHFNMNSYKCVLCPPNKYLTMMEHNLFNNHNMTQHHPNPPRSSCLSTYQTVKKLTIYLTN